MSKKNVFPALKVLSGITMIIVLTMVFQLFIQSTSPVLKNAGEYFEEDLFRKNYSIHALAVPDSLFFAGEFVPLERTYVRESFDRELLVNTYWQSQTLLLIKRANRYFPVIETILKEENIPDDFKYLALIESGFMERAVSPSGAVGIWQFLAGTAKDYGLEVSREVDERYHLEKSTVAAAEYLKKSYQKYGSWTLAAAAYNAGNRGIDRQINLQKVDNYYDLLLAEETGRYVFRILAVKEILSDPAKYGFHFSKEDLYYPISTYEIDLSKSVEDFADFALEHGTTYKELKDLNPWLRSTSLSNPSGKLYTLKLPQPGAFNLN